MQSENKSHRGSTAFSATLTRRSENARWPDHKQGMCHVQWRTNKVGSQTSSVTHSMSAACDAAKETAFLRDLCAPNGESTRIRDSNSRTETESAPTTLGKTTDVNSQPRLCAQKKSDIQNQASRLSDTAIPFTVHSHSVCNGSQNNVCRKTVRMFLRLQL